MQKKLEGIQFVHRRLGFGYVQWWLAEDVGDDRKKLISGITLTMDMAKEQAARWLERNKLCLPGPSTPQSEDAFEMLLKVKGAPR